MSHRLHDITLYYYSDNDQLEKQFTAIQNVVSDLYVYFLSGYKPPKTTRISITLKNEGESINDSFYSGSILIAEASFDRMTFWEASRENKKRLILDTIHRTTLECADKFKWDTKMFFEAYKKVRESDYIFKIESASKFSPDRKVKARLEIEKTEEKAIISANFYDAKDNLIRTVKLFESFQSDIFYGPLVKNFKWFSNNEFGVYSKTGELRITSDMESGQSKITIEPKSSSRDLIEGQLRFVLFRDIDTDDDIVDWANT